jgi:hypothetical protein
VSSRDPRKSDIDTLPTAAAERLLERASQLDSARADEVPVAGLRAAAAEAGISVPAFEAALAELHDGSSAGAPTVAGPSRRAWRTWIVGAGAAVILAVGALAALRQRLLPGGDAVPSVATAEEAILLRCLTPGDAAELVRPLVQDRASSVRFSPAHAPHVLTVRTTPAQLERVKARIADYESAGTVTCTPRSATP